MVVVVANGTRFYVFRFSDLFEDGLTIGQSMRSLQSQHKNNTSSSPVMDGVEAAPDKTPKGGGGGGGGKGSKKRANSSRKLSAANEQKQAVSVGKNSPGAASPQSVDTRRSSKSSGGGGGAGENEEAIADNGTADILSSHASYACENYNLVVYGLPNILFLNWLF